MNTSLGWTQRGRRRALLALVGLAAVLAVLGHRLLVAIALAAALALLAQGRFADRAAAPPADLAGTSLDYERTLSELLGLVGSNVSVFAAARADGWGVTTLNGPLTRAGNVGTLQDDTLFFAVGVDGGFFMPRARFRRAQPIQGADGFGLALHIGEAIVYVLDDVSRPPGRVEEPA